MPHQSSRRVSHRASIDDQHFRRVFEACEVSPAAFDHEAHVRLAYIYLCEESVDGATARMKQAIQNFLQHLGADPAKYHETLTRAWIMAVQYFRSKSREWEAGECASSAEFIAQNSVLLDSKIMLTHYSAAALFSMKARSTFVAPDIQAIPPP